MVMVLPVRPTCSIFLYRCLSTFGSSSKEICSACVSRIWTVWPFCSNNEPNTAKPCGGMQLATLFQIFPPFLVHGGLISKTLAMDITHLWALINFCRLSLHRTPACRTSGTGEYSQMFCQEG